MIDQLQKTQNLTFEEQTPNFNKGATSLVQTLVGKLNGENITKEALKNLVVDKSSPLTTSLVEIDADKGDGINFA